MKYSGVQSQTGFARDPRRPRKKLLALLTLLLRPGAPWALGVLFLFDFSGLGRESNVHAATADQASPSALQAQLNVLLIVVDDLRPELGAYGTKRIRTPKINQLAQQGVTFTRAYAQMSTCAPSRTSMMTGLRPDTTRVTDLKTHFRDTIPSVVTLPEYFKANGYQTQGICKIYHGGLDDTRSWSVPHVDLWGQGTPKGADGKPMAYAAVDAPESGFADGKCADAAMEALQNLQGQPFFLAVGFKKPHLPFVAPPKYFDMYDQQAIPEASNLFRATGAPEFGFDDSAELRNRYSMMPPLGEPFTQSLRRELKRGYYAAVSFVDAQIGRVLSELARLGLEENTLVVLVGDHGWHLGEQDEWGKHTNFEVGTRVPLIIRAPGQAANQRSKAIVELVGLYPTISELAGLPVPDSEQNGGYPLEGESFAGSVANPNLQSRRGAISYWRRGGYVGYSIRTDQYRFTEWVAPGNPAVYELYDHLLDPAETMNVVTDPEYAPVIPSLKAALAAGGQQDLPLNLLPEVRSSVYTVSPCRVVDTRNADPQLSAFSGDGIAPGETVSFYVSGSEIAGQGGASDCGVPPDATGVFANVTAVRPRGSAASGYLTLYPYGESQPTASTINYMSDAPALANGVLVPLCDPAAATCDYDLNIYNHIGPAAHLVIDVTGYVAVPALAF